MRYLVITREGNPFLTEWFDAVNHFNPTLEMVVFDLAKNKYTKDGVEWFDIIEDHL